MSARSVPPGPGVLIVDEEPSIRLLLHNILSARGCVVWESSPGTHAAEVFRRHTDEINLALLDLHLWGLATIAFFKQIKPTLHCCLMVDGGSDEEYLGRGADAILRKPFTWTEVVHWLDSVARPVAPAERRAHFRWKTQAVPFRVLSPSGQQLGMAVPEDVSATGVCLHVSTPYPPGSVLALEPVSARMTTAHPVVFQVTRCQPVPAGGHHLAGRFLSPRDSQALQG